MTLLQELKTHLTNKGIKAPIYLNWATEKATAGACVVLWQYDGTPNMVARNAKVQITVKDKDMKKAEEMSDSIYSILYPIDQYMKVIDINGQNMHIQPIQEPFYNGKDDSGRNCYVFNINVDYDRRS